MSSIQIEPLSARRAPLSSVWVHRAPWVIAAALLVALARVGSDYWLGAILVPFLILSLAGLGLNLATGYAGQLSLGSAAFMSVGAYTAYNFAVRVPALPFALDLTLGALVAAAVGVVF